MTHRMYDVRDDPKNLSTSIATRVFQNELQMEDLVRCKSDKSGTLGLVMRVAGQDDDEEIDEALGEGMAQVWWMRGSEGLFPGTVRARGEPDRDHSSQSFHALEDLELVDRSFCRGCAVSPYVSPPAGAPAAATADAAAAQQKQQSLKQGIVCDIDLHLTVRMLHSKQTIRIHASQLSRLNIRITGAATAKLASFEPEPAAAAASGAGAAAAAQKAELEKKGDAVHATAAAAAASSSSASAEGGERSNFALCSHKAVHYDLVFVFPDGSCCVVFSRHMELLFSELWQKNPAMENIRPRSIDIFYPMQQLTLPETFARASYVAGKWKSAHKTGTVLRAVPYMVTVQLLAATEKLLYRLAENKHKLNFKSNRADPNYTETPPEDEISDELDEGSVGQDDEEGEEDEEDEEAPAVASLPPAEPWENVDGASDWQGEEDGVRASMRLGLHPSLVSSLICYLHESFQFGDTGLLRDGVLEHIQGNAKAAAAAASSAKTNYTDHASPMPTPIPPPRLFPLKHGCGILLGQGEVSKYVRCKKLQQQRLSEYKTVLASKAARQVIENEKRRTVLVLKTERRVKVRWQDGKVSDWIDSNKLFSLMHTQLFDRFAGDFVNLNSPHLVKQIATKPEKRRNQVVSCYDLEGAWSGSDFGVGDLVLWCPRTRRAEVARRARHPQVHAAPAPPVPEHGADATTSALLSTLWLCPRCTLLNPCGVVCRMCGLVKVFAATQPQAKPATSVFQGLVDTLRGASTPGAGPIGALLSSIGVAARAGASAASGDEPAAAAVAASTASAEAADGGDAASQPADAPAAEAEPAAPKADPLSVVQLIACGGIQAKCTPFRMQDYRDPAAAGAAAAAAPEAPQAEEGSDDVPERGSILGVVRCVYPKDRVAKVDWVVLDESEAGTPPTTTAVLDNDNVHVSIITPNGSSVLPTDVAQKVASELEKAAVPGTQLGGTDAVATNVAEMFNKMQASGGHVHAHAHAHGHTPAGAAVGQDPQGEEEKQTFITPADYILAGIVTGVDSNARLTVRWCEWDGSYVEEGVAAQDVVFIDYSDGEDEDLEEDEEYDSQDEDEHHPRAYGSGTGTGSGAGGAAAAAAPAGMSLDMILQGAAEDEGWVDDMINLLVPNVVAYEDLTEKEKMIRAFVDSYKPEVRETLLDKLLSLKDNVNNEASRASEGSGADGAAAASGGGAAGRVNSCINAVRDVVRSVFGGVQAAQQLPESTWEAGEAVASDEGDEDEEEEETAGGNAAGKAEAAEVEVEVEAAATAAAAPAAQPAAKAESDEEEEGGDEEEEEEEDEEAFNVIGNFTDHVYRDTCRDNVNMKAVKAEWKRFHSALPPGIQVVASETQPQLLMALIEGPLHTPYRNCPYIFYMGLTSMFPKEPPKAKIQSYGLRLNPNLYADGYICLSLLGTWDGQQTCEEWREGSTLLQVLISIQGLVLTKEPYYNEAGYHNHLGTAEGRQNSKAYNEQVYLLTLRYLTMLLNAPPLHMKSEIYAIVRRTYQGTLERAEEYCKAADADNWDDEEDEDETPAPAAPTAPADEAPAAAADASPEASTDEAAAAAASTSGKRVITPEELAAASNAELNGDGLVLPVSRGFAVSLATSVLPSLRVALTAAGFPN